MWVRKTDSPRIKSSSATNWLGQPRHIIIPLWASVSSSINGNVNRFTLFNCCDE